MCVCVCVCVQMCRPLQALELQLSIHRDTIRVRVQHHMPFMSAEHHRLFMSAEHHGRYGCARSITDGESAVKSTRPV